ncbi:O-antigen polymerase [Aerococcus urinaehominis]|uniref:O-antigen polymerase n=1 Tax=Aerococcus urinaehominis TaxID=128944 RepID=A0A0X8FMZ0_9LACT|nr:O-antigen polymerase [Aerococcus urinaehominis]
MGVYIIWLLVGLVSVIWAVQVTAWIKGIFLLTLGVLAIVGLYTWVNKFFDWQLIFKGAWLMMTLLTLWGLTEIVTNTYLFADLATLDKYRTFASQPWTRIPITHFTNQNDFATMQLAYLASNGVIYHLTRTRGIKIVTVLMTALSLFLIFQSGSRMSLLMGLAYFLILILLQFKWDFKKHHYILAVLGLLVLVSAVWLLVPSIRSSLSSLYYTGQPGRIYGDTARVNMWRNGLIFLGQTLGFGVGAGNLPFWLEHYAPLPINKIYNIHNWWLEILVGYGWLVFALYLVMYGLVLYRLNQVRHRQNSSKRQVTNALMTFMIIFIPASITSANNMMIEWHWIFFGLIISYLHIMEKEYLINRRTR